MKSLPGCYSESRVSASRRNPTLCGGRHGWPVVFQRPGAGCQGFGQAGKMPEISVNARHGEDAEHQRRVDHQLQFAVGGSWHARVGRSWQNQRLRRGGVIRAVGAVRLAPHERACTGSR
jgi:hypothetical protein